ncbi:SUMF1/EgtB/PvdO family nonheme iron enzyme [Haliangium sp.]|uniref:SUMF1/EgtB/PvdO family nonheme iron enzyme n=1 Tax=Haliangium sp. TaxID=2663208 RepID=UPI003D10E50E
MSELSRKQQDQLVGLLEACAVLRDGRSRSMLIDRLPEHIRPYVHDDAPNLCVLLVGLVDGCVRFPGGVEALRDELRFLEGDTHAMKAVADFVASTRGRTSRLAIVDPVPMVDIPAGSFVMGSPDGDDMADDDEKPAHLVLVSAFRCMRTPVTRAQWTEIMGVPHHWDPPGPADEHPINNVSWYEAVRFCNALSQRAGLSACYRIDGHEETWVASEGYRLPTEAEWEYACRAGRQTRYCFGDDAEGLDEYAWFDDNSGGTLQPVGQKRANDWGLYDMHGNVFEWCWDWYAPYPDSPSGPPVLNPRGPAQPLDDPPRRVLRGGSFINGTWDSRGAGRSGSWPAIRNWSDGFRCVRGSGSGH